MKMLRDTLSCFGNEVSYVSLRIGPIALKLFNGNNISFEEMRDKLTSTAPRGYLEDFTIFGIAPRTCPEEIEDLIGKHYSNQGFEKLKWEEEIDYFTLCDVLGSIGFRKPGSNKAQIIQYNLYPSRLDVKVSEEERMQDDPIMEELVQEAYKELPDMISKK